LNGRLAGRGPSSLGWRVREELGSGRASFAVTDLGNDQVDVGWGAFELRCNLRHIHAICNKLGDRRILGPIDSCHSCSPRSNASTWTRSLKNLPSRATGKFKFESGRVNSSPSQRQRRAAGARKIEHNLTPWRDL
jgi:hypothetical protein